MFYCKKGFMFFLFFTTLLLSCHLHDLVTASVSEVADHHETPYSYSQETGKGPMNWGKINKDWRVCGDGKFQSPIDIVGETVQVAPNLGELKKEYKPAPAVLENRGHDISVRWKEDPGQININGTVYNLIQFHVHTPSEHTFNGSRYDLEIHMVHKTSDNKTAVIGILYEFGQPDPFLSKLFPDIKTLGKEKEKEIGTVNPGDIKFGSQNYYRYIGSLTTPPCTEDVVWTIVDKVKTVSEEQVTAFKEHVQDGFKENARPTRPLEGRPVFFFNQ